MAFSFTSNQNNPSSFGGFGNPATSTPGFGGFGATTSTFGTSGGTTFGATPATSTFGTATNTGGLFGATQQSQNPAFGATAPPAFGATSTSNTTIFGSTPQTFGQANTGTTAFGGTGAFGAPTSTSFGGFGSFGTTPASSAGGTLFSNTGGGLFGGTSTSGTSGGFTSFGGTSAAGTLFGGNTSTPSLNLGGFGTKTTSSFGAYGGFSAPTQSFGIGQPSGGLFASQAPQQQQQPQEDPLVVSVNNVIIFNDERDAVLKRWNGVLAQWGTGKGYYHSQAQPVTYTPQNIYSKFKALGYNLLPGGKDEDGIVSVTVGKKEPEVRAQQQQIQITLQNLLVGRQMTVALQEVRGSTNDTTQVLVTVTEKSQTGQTRKIPATEFANFLNNSKAQLGSIGVTNVAAVVAPSQEEINSYLANPPIGIEPRLWNQAISDNPDPKRYVPVPMIGFAELRSRMNCQEAESARHVAFLAQAKDRLQEMQRQASEAREKLEQRTLSLRSLQQRLMKALIKLQVYRREGTALLPIEEELRARLEQINNAVSQPNHCKVRLSELMSQTELKSFMGSNSDYSGKYQLDGDSLQELHKYLKMEQQGISHLIDIATSDAENVQFLQQDMSQVSQAANDNSISLRRSQPNASLSALNYPK
ncbi:nucleoporin p54 [Neocloeon triangulifer]|uniref:nucleoporin p54 n=1 Tax=Neocloeon triangulifer TaxID=2078957 RepID=UPI00286F52F7|nr:nucleoporin p54 [Neocloeon triangulifer]XP_059482561.1 nucleoporin p54 [Neocloeon triangulifer]XP_059482562.1 nucleoporin p54 [Neocloeon triangulifer]